ncbi:hypothetical protein ANN_21545 [Periplaneta americana]|uniref:Secreted protein n=1 Tax=Periplaneta americana TaxID=6978 RepID=A0ABQ8S5R8_PERAM|nr:hypothetical protein ANN_21545 [Periplaneta americana]
MLPGHCTLLVLIQEHQVVSDHVADVQIDDPVHEVEADEADREDDARVLVDVAGGDAVQLVDVFARVNQVLGCLGGLLVRPAVDGVLQRAPLRMGLGVVDFETHLLEQRAWPGPTPLTRYTTQPARAQSTGHSALELAQCDTGCPKSKRYVFFICKQ